MELNAASPGKLGFQQRSKRQLDGDAPCSLKKTTPAAAAVAAAAPKALRSKGSKKAAQAVKPGALQALLARPLLQSAPPAERPAEEPAGVPQEGPSTQEQEQTRGWATHAATPSPSAPQLAHHPISFEREALSDSEDEAADAVDVSMVRSASSSPLLSTDPACQQFNSLLARVSSHRLAVQGTVVTLRHCTPGSRKAGEAMQQQLALLKEIDALLCVLEPQDAADAAED